MNQTSGSPNYHGFRVTHKNPPPGGVRCPVGIGKHGVRAGPRTPRGYIKEKTTVEEPTTPHVHSLTHNGGPAKLVCLEACMAVFLHGTGFFVDDPEQVSGILFGFPVVVNPDLVDDDPPVFGDWSADS